MAGMKSKHKNIAAIVLVFLIIAGIAAYFIVSSINESKNYVSLSELGDDYTFESVDIDDIFIVNEPDPDGALIFRNADGDEKKVHLNDDGVTVSGLSTKEAGTFTMSVTARGVTKTVEYTVDYKEIRYSGSSVIYLSINDPIELDGIRVDCIDYNDRTVKRIPLRDFFDADDFDVDSVSDAEKYLSSSDYGYIDLKYKVGYIGYGNTYVGTDTVRDGRYEYELYDFVMDTTNYGDEGDGSLTILYQYAGSLDDLTDFETIDFYWEKDYVNDDMIILKDGQFGDTIGAYYYLEHRLELDANAFDTAGTLEFTLEYLD